MSAALSHLPPPPPSPEPQRGISFQLNVGAIAQSCVGFLLVLVINYGIGQLKELNSAVQSLNTNVAVLLSRADAQEKRDLQQDARLDKHRDQLLELERIVSAIHRAQRAPH